VVCPPSPTPPAQGWTCPSASDFTVDVIDNDKKPSSHEGSSSGVDVHLKDGTFSATSFGYRNLPPELLLYPGFSPNCRGTISGGQSITCIALMALSTNVDTDKDSIPDSWETGGIPYNGTNGALQHYKLSGANSNHKDLYVEVDYMKDHKPYSGVLENVKKAFSDASVDNPDKTKGINLYTDLGDEIPHEDTTTLDNIDDSIKPKWFGTAAERADTNHDAMLAAKSIVYHYEVFAHQQPGTSSSGLGYTPGMNSIVTLGACAPAPGFCWPKDPNTKHTVGSLDQQEGTFMHELGHNLGFEHGGGDQVNCKPNYFSVMNYLFQFSNPVSDRPLDFSRSALNSLDKTNLNEPAGLTKSDRPNTQPPVPLRTAYGPFQEGKEQAFAFANGSALDWNQNGIKTDTAVNADINSDFGTCVGDGGGPDLNGFNDWSNIKYISQIYPQQQQAGSQQQGVASGRSGQNLPPASEKELTLEGVMRSNLMLIRSVNDAVAQIKSGQTTGQTTPIKQTAFEVQNLIGVLKSQQPPASSPTAGAATGTPPLMATTAPGSAAMPGISSSLPPEVTALMQNPTGGMSVDTNHVAQLVRTGELGTAIGELDKLLAEVSTLDSSLSQLQQQQQQQQQQPPSSQQQLQTPMANAGVSQTVEANATVMLDGRNSQPAKPGTTITAYQWTQLPTQGAVPVNLIGGPNIPTPMFIAPTLPYDTTLSFGLRVMASDGSVSTNDAVAHIMVKRYTGPMTGAGAASPLGAFQQQPPAQLQQQPQQPFQQQQPILPPQQQLPGMGQQQQLPGMGQQQQLPGMGQQQPNLPTHITP
jgi:hypothetical protein